MAVAAQRRVVSASGMNGSARCKNKPMVPTVCSGIRTLTLSFTFGSGQGGSRTRDRGSAGKESAEGGTAGDARLHGHGHAAAAGGRLQPKHTSAIAVQMPQPQRAITRIPSYFGSTSLSPSTRHCDQTSCGHAGDLAAVLHPAHSGWCSSHPASISFLRPLTLQSVITVRMRRELAARLSSPGSSNHLGLEAIAHEGGRGREGRGRGHDGRGYDEAGHCSSVECEMNNLSE